MKNRTQILLILAIVALTAPAAQAQTWAQYRDSAQAHPYHMPDSDRAMLRAQDSTRILSLTRDIEYSEKRVALARATHDVEMEREYANLLPVKRQTLARRSARFLSDYGHAWRTPGAFTEK